MAITLDGTNGITTPTYSGTDTSEYVVPVTAFKNRIINGAMMIDQRNAGASVGTASGASVYTVDRWQAVYSQTSKFTIQQNAGSVTPPAGYTNYVGVTSSSAYSVTSTDFFVFRQSIEGLNLSDLGWGTASAQTITVSFWVRSSLTGTFGAVVMNSAANRSYPFTYTISSANTWEYKTATIAGDTSGTWLTTNGVGLYLQFGLGIGATYSGTAGAWTGTSNIFGATGATSVVGTNGATFYITGVQLEKGSTATSFDYRPYGTELQLCQRYYQKYNDGTSYYPYGMGNWISTTNVSVIKSLLVQMRSNPSFTFTNATNTYINNGATAISVTSISPDVMGNDCIIYAVFVASGGTAGYGSRHFQNATNASNLQLSAEL